MTIASTVGAPRPWRIWLLTGCVAGLLLPGLPAQEDEPDPVPSPTSAVRWRGVGPAVMSGRFVDVAVSPVDPTTIYAAAASGGLWKTTNRGTTWSPIFDGEGTQTIGAIAIAKTAPDTVWVGTGEANNQRSSYAGIGVFKSSDGGRSWSFMGLPESHHIGRIAIHPGNPDVVYVAALGHLYSPNAERGLYRTRDGGRSWELVLSVDADTGAVDVLIHPTKPDLVLAATYQRRRRAWHFSEAGPGSGVYRSTDGGTSFTAVQGGFPAGQLGRIGLAAFAANPDVMFACVENRNPRPAGDEPETDAPRGRAGRRREPDATSEAGGEPDHELETEVGPEHWAREAEEEAEVLAAPAKIVGGEVYRSDDAGVTWRRMNEKPVSGEPPYYYGQIRCDPKDDQRLWLLGVALYRSTDGGKTWNGDGAKGIHVDHHALWIDPADPEHLLLGNDGGLARSHDRGATWDVFPNLPVSQFYTVHLDDRSPYRIYGGLQDNGTWGMPAIGSTRAGIMPWEPYSVNGGDGFYVLADPENQDVVLSESQFGGLSRLDLRTGARRSVRPQRKKGEAPLRFNWSSPLVGSPHAARTIWFGAERLFRSVDRGDHFEAVSPDLTTADPEKLRGNVPHCTITTISESPRKRGTVWVGTDDGNVQLTQDDGRHWINFRERFPDDARGLWVSRVLASSHVDGRAYVAFSGYREDRFEPFLFVTDDFGGTWNRLGRGLGVSPVNVVLEDSKNADLLFAGTDLGVFASMDGGDSFEPLGRGLPKVAVHDLALQPRYGDLVVATHGRGFWVAHVEPLRQLTSARRGEAAHLCAPAAIMLPGRAFDRGYPGARRYLGSNPEFGARIAFHLSSLPKEAPTLEIQSLDGRRLRRLEVRPKLGLNELVWDLRVSGRPGLGLPGRQRGGPGGGGATASPGDYLVVLTVGEHVLKARITVPVDAEGADTRVVSEEGEEDEERKREGDG